MTGPVLLSDLIAEGKFLWVYCRSCGHERDIDPASLRLPANIPVPDVGKRLVCSQCGGRAITTWPELYPGGNDGVSGEAQSTGDGVTRP